MVDDLTICIQNMNFIKAVLMDILSLTELFPFSEYEDKWQDIVFRIQIYCQKSVEA